jgi:hypothetical protein
LAVLQGFHQVRLRFVSGGTNSASRQTGGSFAAQQRRLVALALRARLPTISSVREDVEAGMLMSYGESYKEFNWRAAFYVDKIIRGAKSAGFPTETETDHRSPPLAGVSTQRGNSPLARDYVVELVGLEPRSITVW